MILQKQVKEILKKIAKVHNISYEEAEKIWLSQWRMLREVLNESETNKTVDTFKFPKWGRYYTSPGKIRGLEKKQAEYEKILKQRKENERILLDALDRTNSSDNK